MNSPLGGHWGQERTSCEWTAQEWGWRPFSLSLSLSLSLSNIPEYVSKIQLIFLINDLPGAKVWINWIKCLSNLQQISEFLVNKISPSDYFQSKYTVAGIMVLYYRLKITKLYLGNVKFKFNIKRLRIVGLPKWCDWNNQGQKIYL